MNVIEITGKAGNTFTVASTDTSQNLDAIVAMVFKDSNGRLVTTLLITVNTKDISFCFGSTPVQGGLGHILTTNMSLYLRNPANMRAFNFISKASGEAGALMITPYYGDY